MNEIEKHEEEYLHIKKPDPLNLMVVIFALLIIFIIVMFFVGKYHQDIDLARCDALDGYCNKYKCYLESRNINDMQKEVMYTKCNVEIYANAIRQIK